MTVIIILVQVFEDNGLIIIYYKWIMYISFQKCILYAELRRDS